MLPMLAAIDPAVTVAVIAAALGPIGAYLVAARRLSGKIANSDAEQLWEESKAIREWSGARLNAQDDEIVRLRENLIELTKRCTILETENRLIRQQLAKHESGGDQSEKGS